MNLACVLRANTRAILKYLTWCIFPTVCKWFKMQSHRPWDWLMNLDKLVARNKCVFYNQFMWLLGVATKLVWKRVLHQKPCDLLASRLLKSLLFWMKDADFSANASRFFVFVCNLLATKAIARRFSVQRHIPHCFQFHLATTCNLHQLFARRLRNTQFSLVTSILVLVYYIVTRVLLTSLQPIWQWLSEISGEHIFLRYN